MKSSHPQVKLYWHISCCQLLRIRNYLGSKHLQGSHIQKRGGKLGEVGVVQRGSVEQRPAGTSLLTQVGIPSGVVAALIPQA